MSAELIMLQHFVRSEYFSYEFTKNSALSYPFAESAIPLLSSEF